MYLHTSIVVPQGAPKKLALQTNIVDKARTNHSDLKSHADSRQDRRRRIAMSSWATISGKAPTK
jgi:hypothetical protein